ncbi:MAG: hypothetical protein WC708_19755 [Lentisphaeria bacterium]
MKQSEDAFTWSCTCGHFVTGSLDMVGRDRDCQKCKKHLEYIVRLSEPIERKEYLKLRFFDSKKNAIEYSEFQQKYWHTVVVYRNDEKIIRFGYNGTVKTMCPRVRQPKVE